MIPLRYNVRNLMVRWRVTLLTAFGFLLVVAILVVMLAFVEGINELARRAGRPDNVIVLREGTNDELFSDIADTADLARVWLNEYVATDSAGEPLFSPEVYAIATQQLPPDPRDGRPRYRFLQIRGVLNPPRAAAVHGLQLLRGRWFSSVGNECVMGEGIAALLGLDVGSSFTIREGLTWQVVGILDSRGTPFDSETWAKREVVGQEFGKDNVERGQRFFTSILLRLRDPVAVSWFCETIKDRTGLEVSAVPEPKYYERMSEANTMFLAAALFIAAIMAVGGMFGLMNTMFATVTQRTKDIAVLRILGYQRWQILLSFLLEAMLLALLGGLAGMAVGSMFHGVEQKSFISSGQGGGKTVVFQITVTPFVLRTAFWFTVVMGFLGGLIPSWAATRLRPLEALR
ncbi:MAG: ABC transporter permease [Gemmatales bacterium]|nr:ABC transporter permease [Gemmatales bacterium]MCS7161429.1 ABC transporter permease [Gemmatales bacterium]MDW8176632.1 ABC transporter permease [Gemmatales bacterium]MDW8222723.1 ABC transporter permease [Gemmatales bacterium]